MIAARLQDINEGLTRQTGGLVEAHYRKSKRLGSAARICSLIGGQEVIKDYNALVAAAGELAINADTLETALTELQEIGYITIHRGVGGINKVEERIPLLSDRYEAIGQKWLDSQPSDIEKASLEMLDELMIMPFKERVMQKKHGIGSAEFGIIRDVGKTGDFFKSYTSPKDGSRIIYSPLYHDENPDKFFALMKNFPTEEIVEKLKGIRRYQGNPVDTVQDALLLEAIRVGCIPTPTVESSNGAKQFMFTPLRGVGRLEKSLLEKARAIVACARYGQHFAQITRITNPLAILQTLKYKRSIGPHSEIGRQYFLLQKLGVGRISKHPNYTSRYNFQLIDNVENLKAMDYAIQYLTVRDIVRGEADIQGAKQLLLPGFYSSPTKTRLDLTHVKNTKMSESSVNELQHLMIGGSSDIF